MGEALDDEDRILAAIRRIVRAIDLHSRQLVARVGLTGPQLATLQDVARRGQASPSDLARALSLSGPTMSGIVDRLVARGFLVRTRDPSDRRRILLTLTPSAREAVDAAPSLLQERFRAELAKLEEWERTAMLSTLQRIASMMDAEDLAASPLLVTGPGVDEADSGEE